MGMSGCAEEFQACPLLVNSGVVMLNGRGPPLNGRGLMLNGRGPPLNGRGLMLHGRGLMLSELGGAI